MAFTMRSLVCLYIFCSITHSMPVFPPLPSLRPLFQFGATTLTADPPNNSETTSSTTEMSAVTQNAGFTFPMPDPGLQFPGLNIPGFPAFNIPGLNIPGLNGQLPFPLLPFPFPMPLLFDLNNLGNNLRFPDQSSSFERSVSDPEDEGDVKKDFKFTTPYEDTNSAAEEN